jgi:hypothetical protein
MITIYAKNIAGDITHLSLPVLQTYHSLCSTLVALFTSHDPSRLCLLSHLSSDTHNSKQSEQSKQSKQSDMDDKDDTDEKQDMTYDTWNDGDIVLYLLQDSSPLTVHLLEPLSLIYPTSPSGRRNKKQPYYLIHIYLQNSVNTVFRYPFLFSLSGTFLSPSQYTLEDDDDDDSYLFIHSSSTPFSSIYDLIQNDLSIPLRFQSIILRAIYRKWSRFLKHMSASVKKYCPSEYHQLQQHFYAFHTRSYPSQLANHS